MNITMTSDSLCKAEEMLSPPLKPLLCIPCNSLMHTRFICDGEDTVLTLGLWTARPCVQWSFPLLPAFSALLPAHRAVRAAAALRLCQLPEAVPGMEDQWLLRVRKELGFFLKWRRHTCVVTYSWSLAPSGSLQVEEAGKLTGSA